MVFIQKKLFVLINFMFLLNYFNGSYLAETNQKSIIKLFCINSFKEEMAKAAIEYSDEIANETCKCYLDEFMQNASHQNAITKCKLEARKQFKSLTEIRRYRNEI